jgi:hypothetical protein
LRAQNSSYAYEKLGKKNEFRLKRPKMQILLCFTEKHSFEQKKVKFGFLRGAGKLQIVFDPWDTDVSGKKVF